MLTQRNNRNNHPTDNFITMLNPEDRTKHAKVSKECKGQQSTYKRMVEQLQSTLKKPFEQRFHQEQQHIL